MEISIEPTKFRIIAQDPITKQVHWINCETEGSAEGKVEFPKDVTLNFIVEVIYEMLASKELHIFKVSFKFKENDVTVLMASETFSKLDEENAKMIILKRIAEKICS